MKPLQITITLEHDNKTINFVDINGCNHHMYDEPQDEKERYQKMTVAEFIADYVDYYFTVGHERKNNMFDIHKFEETLQTEYEETNDMHKVIGTAVQYIRNQISCRNLVEESKLKWILDKYEFKNGSELLGYIGYLEDIKADYEFLKSEVLKLASVSEKLY